MKDYALDTKAVYDSNPDYFDKKFGEYVRNFVSNQLEGVCCNLPRGAEVLDLGSGTGNHASFFRYRGFDVLCLDISEEMLRKCREKGLRTIRMDFENLYFKEKSFDLVWAYTSLLHIPKENMPRMISEIHKIVRYRGFFGLSLKEGIGEGFVDFKKVGRRWFSLYTDDEVRRLLEPCFTMQKMWRVPVSEGKAFLDYFCRKK